jgi:AraC-like DNA-binding protein
MIERAPPPPDLADLVEEFSARRAVGPRAALPVFASARVELVFHFGDPFLVADDMPLEPRFLAPATMLGPRDRRYWQLAGPRIDWFIVQLTPLGCRRLLDCRFADLWHREAALGDFWGTEANSLHESLASATGFAARVAIASAALRARARISGGDADTSRLATLARRGRLRSVGQLASCSDLGPRRLRQRFGEEIGAGPKHFLNVMRFGRLLTSLHPRPWLGTTADETEYADDSHAIRAFRRFAGTTPGRYRAAKAKGDELVFTGPALPLG